MTTPPPAEVRALLEACFRAALRRADPARGVREAVVRRGGALEIAEVPLEPGASLRVLAAGKAAIPMAAALETQAGDRIAAGLCVTKEGQGSALARMRVLEAGHPVPDARSEEAGRAALRLAAECAPSDLFVVLLSGGASALLACPLPGLAREDVAAATRALLAAGADIAETNAVRKHLVALAGGRLARAAAARRVVVLALSDVPGDDPAVIGSGPCAPDPSTFADALAVVERRGLRERLPAAALEQLEAGAAGRREETLEPGDPALARVRTRLLATNRDALEAARAAASEQGLRTHVVTERLAGEARRAGARLAALGAAVRAPAPVLLLAGGETTVTVRGRGRGGRSQELALAAALALEGEARVALLAAGTDGADGPTDAAGAHADGGTAERGRARGASPERSLRRNDAYGFFHCEGGLFRTGPTGTNVMDLVLLHVAPGPVCGGGETR